MCGWQVKSWSLVNTGIFQHLSDECLSKALYKCICAFLQSLASEPCTAVVFSSSSLYNKPVPVTFRKESSCDGKGPAAKREKLSFAAYLKRILPPTCNLLGLLADGIVGEYSFTQNNHGHVCEKM